MERSVTSRYHGSIISKSQQSFLTETAICIVKRWKKRMGFRLFLECNLAQESHIWQFSSLFLSYLPNHGLLRSRNLLPWQRDTTTSPFYWTTGFRQDKRRNLTIFFNSSHLFIYLFEGRNFGRTIITLALTLLWMKKRKRKVMTVRICSRKRWKMTKKTFSMYGATSHIPSTLAAVMRSLYIV